MPEASNSIKSEAQGALGRIAVAVGLVVGVASFFYALSKDDRERWIWILLGVVLVAASAKYVVLFAIELGRRYLWYQKNLTALGQAQSDLVQAEDQVTALSNDVRKARKSGLAEGVARVNGVLLSHGAELEARNFSMSSGAVILSAVVVNKPPLSPSGTDDVSARARFALVYADTDQVIAMMEAVETAAEITLRSTAVADPNAWSKFEQKAILGESAGAGLALRPSSLADYKLIVDDSDYEEAGPAV